MTVKTLTAPTITAALADARRMFGDDVVLLESHPPQGSRQARVVVAAEAAPAVSQDAASISRVIERVKKEPAPAFGYAAAGSTVDWLVEDDAADGDDFSHPAPPRGRARGRLFPSDGPLRSDDIGTTDIARSMEQLLEKQLGSLFERLDGIERRFDGHPASAGKWLRHPLFNRLLDRGLKPETVTELFFNVTSGDDLTDDDALYWALARNLRDALAGAAPTAAVGTQLFIGPNGSGKTSLILRLATHKNFYGRRRCGIIIARPPSDEERIEMDATDIYRRAGLPVQNVRTGEEMEMALARLRDFDHVLIDTPGLPFRPRPMRDALAALKPLVQRLVPLQTHFVIDATRALDELDPELLRRMPVAPDLVALTHMDETARPGRTWEWLVKANLPVNIVGLSNDMRSGLTTFSAAAFAERLLEA